MLGVPDRLLRNVADVPGTDAHQRRCEAPPPSPTLRTVSSARADSHRERTDLQGQSKRKTKKKSGKIYSKRPIAEGVKEEETEERNAERAKGVE